MRINLGLATYLSSDGIDSGFTILKHFSGLCKIPAKVFFQVIALIPFIMYR